ncbi:MAG: ATP-binding protein [Candidatus Eremiobacteraeota bacterium]|nr:ATP-binding protein [Candidatus Eremiobacteraeota bacterium]
MEDLSAHILDIVENSINASAKRVSIKVTEDAEKDLLTVEIEDNGRGLKEEDVKRVQNPFFTTRTTRRVGLGLPLLKQAAQACGGTMEIVSEEGKGTRVKATFGYSHIDRQPLGDIAEILRIMIQSNPDTDFVYEHKSGDEHYRLDTSEMKGEQEDD